MNIRPSVFAEHTLSVWMVGLMFAVPFTIGYHITPIPSFYNEMVAFVFGLLALLPLCGRQAWSPVRIPYAVFGLFAFVLVLLVQSAIGLIPTQSQTLMYVCYVLWAAALMCLGALHQQQLAVNTVVETLAKVIVTVAWLSVAYVALQLMQKMGYIQPSFLLAPTYGAISQTNHFANFTAIAIASLLYLQFGRAPQTPSSNKQSIALQRIKQTHFVLALSMFVALLTFSASRSSWLYLIVLLLFALYQTIAAPRTRQIAVDQASALSAPNTHLGRLTQSLSNPFVRWVLLLLPLFALMQLLLSWLAAEYVMTAAQRFSEFGDTQVVGGLKLRLLMWQQTMQYFLAQPWWGIGLHQSRGITFADPTLQYVMAGGMGAYEHPHNLLVQLLSETGLIGTLVLLLPLWAWCRAIIAQPNTLADWWIHSVLSIVLIHSMLEYPLSYAYFLGLLAYLIGYQQRASMALPTLVKKILHGCVTIVIAFGLLCSAHTVMAYQKLDHWIRLLGTQQFNAQHMDGFYQTVSWMNSKSILKAYSYPMYLLAIEFLPIENSAKQAINEVSLKIVPMPKSAYLQVVYLLQQQQTTQAQQAMLLAVKAFPGDYQDRLKSVPAALLPSYEAMYQQAIHTIKRPTTP